MLLTRFEWDNGHRECVMALKNRAKKLGSDFLEVWAVETPSGVEVNWSTEPRYHPKAVYRSKI